MGYSHPEAPASLVPRGVGAELQPARRPQGGREVGARIVSVMLAMLLAVTMLPAAGLSSAYADEPVERPATSGGDVALEGANGAAGEAAAASQAPVAETREDGMLAADGLMYTVADGGLALVGFDGEVPEGMLVVPAAVMLDGRETPVVAIGLAEGQAADKVVVLSLPQSIKDIDTASLASAFPALLSVEVAGAPSSLPVAAGAASVRAAYSTSGGMLFRPTSVTVQADDGSIESIECKELLWAPPALVSARIPVECRAVAEGAFADVRDLKTVVAFGTMERIAEGAFSTEQMESAKVVVPQASPAVTDAERVSANMALMGDAGQKERRSAWHEAGWRTDDIVMGKPYGSLTETVAVTDEGAIERTELQLVSYPGAHERAMDLKKPNDDGVVEQAECGLAFTVKSDMTASVTWQGDKTATPAHVDIPAAIVIDGVTYPVAEIAPNAFEGAVFLQSISIPDGVTAIGQDAFKDCPNLTEFAAPSMLRRTAEAAPDDAPEGETNPPIPSQEQTIFSDDSISPYLSTNNSLRMYLNLPLAKSVKIQTVVNMVVTVVNDYEFLFSTTRNDLTGYWGAYVTADGQGVYRFHHASGGTFATVSIRPPSGYAIAGFGAGNQTLSTEVNSYNEIGYVTLVRAESVGTSPLLTTNSFAGTGSAATAARSDHNHDGTYAKVTDLGSYVTTSALDGRNYITKAVSDLDNFYDKAKFNTISYEGLDEADYAGALPTFYVNDAAKLPKVPEPRREGHEFLGWTWSGQATPTKDPGSAFSGGGAVTLVANWDETDPETPEAKHFFTSDAPLRHDDASATQTHVIKVRLASSPGTLASVSFEGDDRTGLLKETSGVRLFVGASEDALASGTELSWGGATPSGWECELARFSDDSYGVYVGVSVPTSAIDESAIPVSYADGSYVASLVKMNYAFA